MQTSGPPTEPSCRCRGEAVTLRALIDDVNGLDRRDAAIRTLARFASWTEPDRLPHAQC